MQFQIKRDKLLKSLTIAHNIIERKNTLPILSNVLLEIKNKTLNVIATDLDIIFHGYQEDVLPFYKHCHLLVNPSYSEGSPLCVIEGIEVGIPCIGSDISPILEILGKEHVFRKGSTRELRNKIVQMQSNSSFLQKNHNPKNKEEYFRIIN